MIDCAFVSKGLEQKPSRSKRGEAAETALAQPLSEVPSVRRSGRVAGLPAGASDVGSLVTPTPLETVYLTPPKAPKVILYCDDYL